MEPSPSAESGNFKIQSRSKDLFNDTLIVKKTIEPLGSTLNNHLKNLLGLNHEID